MVRESLSVYRRRIYGELEAALAATHTPHEIAGSFAIGVFVVVLPSLGLGLLLFLFLVRLSDRISSIAIFSSAIVINPLVKAPMYITAFWIGTRLLGPSDSPTGTLAEATAVAVRMLSGFFVLAAVIAVVGYLVVYVAVTVYRRRDAEIVETIVDDELLSE
jgi:uncharacterized protein (DUF2062 family)